MRAPKRQITRFEKIFWSGQSLEELYGPFEPAEQRNGCLVHRRDAGVETAVTKAASRRLHSLQSRIDRVLDVTINRETDRLEKRLLFLATVGSSAPFIGLFGTVWGIMTSFQAIAASKNTNLAVVAPGIAEALFATALGLLAAIPAVIAYNKFSNEVGRLSLRMEGFADEFAAILSRQIDERL